MGADRSSFVVVRHIMVPVETEGLDCLGEGLDGLKRRRIYPASSLIDNGPVRRMATAPFTQIWSSSEEERERRPSQAVGRRVVSATCATVRSIGRSLERQRVRRRRGLGVP
jgi:hypothetical protein